VTTLGRFEIIDTLGAGSMGLVYRARDMILEREVALKTIRTGAEVVPELRERFYREARACARLQHPNIITVFDLGEVDRTAYIAMELLIGSDFKKIIERRERFPLGVKVEAMIQVCAALAHAHRHGVIHRDVKPSNLFLQQNGRAKVLDFGIARLPSSRLTTIGRVLGTPNYMAPEQLQRGVGDARSDLFSAAIVFFEFLVFVHPFRSNSTPHRIVEGEPDSLLDYEAGIPVILDKILSKGLAKDPDRRYQSGGEFAEDLRAVLDAELQNASTGFSGFELPSERSSGPESSVSPDAAALANTLTIPPGEDPAEWRLSAVLRILPEFEEALARGDLVKTRERVSELEGIATADARFVEALKNCRRQSAELALAMANASTASVVLDPTKPQAPLGGK
jgi:serine/threonine protein kinase